MDKYTEIAKKAVEQYIIKGKILSNFPKEMYFQKAGVFVTLRKNGNLRGCIGTYLPTRNNIAEEIVFNAIAAATEDPRFHAVQKDELKDLKYTVSALQKPQKIKNISELDPKKYGVLIKSSLNRSALLLPDIDGIDTVEKQLQIVCEKGDIRPTEKMDIYKFEIEKHE